jgi:NADPH:quinone reductase-like Zn-dependent oxidoreductase
LKAIVYERYGFPDVLQLKEIEKPVPKDDQVLIKVHATTVNRTDYATIKAIPFFLRIVTGLFKPKRQIPGSDFAGEIETVGQKVTSLQAGDKVFGFDGLGAGSHAQYLAIKEDNVMRMPDNISYKQAAASIEGAYYAYSCIKKADIRKGHRVLVNGATGAIGSAAVQLLKHLDATITAVCATPNIELVKSLGAHKVIDYLKDDFTMDDQKYDFIYDAVGKSSFFKCKHVLRSGGVYISSDLGYMAQNLFLPLLTPIIKPFNGNKKTIFPTPTDIRESLQFIKKLLEQDRFKAVIDREFPIEQIVDAYEYVGKGQKIGNVILALEQNEKT